MTWADWLSIATICALGAVSPGPSLALLVRCTASGGRSHGIAVALAHACGIGVYALLVALGLAAVITGSPVLFAGLQWGGAAFLLWLGIQGVRSKGAALASVNGAAAGSIARAARSGFLIAFLNPKIAIWFLALFSQFVAAETTLPERVGMAALAAVIDGTWYVLVAVTLSTGPLLAWLQTRSQMIDRVLGVVLIALAIRVALN